jgi:hypothetical protein
MHKPRDDGGYGPSKRPKDARYVEEYWYDNIDRNGDPIRHHKIERWENDKGERSFPQYHWIEKGVTGKSHWAPNAPKGPKLPYNYPQLVKAAPEVPIFICEGEKDTETVTGLGLVATTNPNGAGKWTADLSKHFKGRKTVYILEDNDNDGRRHVAKVADHLNKIVGGMYLITFRDMPEHSDVSDWVAAGGTKEELFKRATPYIYIASGFQFILELTRIQ